MRVAVRRILAVVIGAVTALLVALWTIIGSLVIRGYVWANLALDVPLSQADGPRPDSYDQAAHPFYGLLVGALLVATGITTALLVLIPRRDFRVRAAVYLIFMAVILPASLYNYSQRDAVLPALYQVGLNLVVVFLGATIAFSISMVKAESPDTRVLKMMSIGLVLFGAVLVPAFFSLIWGVWRSGLVQEVPKFKWSELSGLGGLASAAIVGWLHYRQQLPERTTSDLAPVSHAALDPIPIEEAAIEAQDELSRFSAEGDTGAALVMMQTTFISYGGPDEAFAHQLHKALHANGVATFFFAEHAIPGKNLHRLMREGVNKHDRVILICSKASLDRPGVLNEIQETLAREARDGGAEYLIPIRLDDYVFKGWNPPDPGAAQAIRDRVVADFEGADTDPAIFDRALQRLLTALKKVI
jgi:hypothetical protein